MLTTILIYLGCGAIVGILAGLLGVGGGTVIVPILATIFPMQGVLPQYVQQMALGTSLASIMVTSVSSAYSHNKKGAVRWNIVREITPGILLGTFFGGLIATHLPTTFLKIFFICFLFAISFHMIRGKKTKESSTTEQNPAKETDIKDKPEKAEPTDKNQRKMPGALGTSAAGGVIGLLSSFVGIGGGSLSVPFMTYCNVPMHTAVGTSAAIGFPIAVAGALGYITGGWNAPGLPSGCLGFVNLWALLGIAVASFITAPLGVKLSHALPTKKLKISFAIFLILIALKMTWDLIKA